MSTDPKQISERWPDQYASLLESYVEQPTEEVLRRATTLGHSLFENSVSPDDVAAAHMAGIERLCERRGMAGCTTLSAARPLLAELMKVYSRAYERQRELARRLGERTRHLNGAEEQVPRAHDQLDCRVNDRSARLAAANEKLRKEIAQHKRTEQALRESEARYRQLFATVSDAIMVFDAQTKQFVDVNDAALGLYGYTRAEFLSLRHPDITAEPEASTVSIEQALAGELTRIPLRYHRKKDGTVFPVEISASALTRENRRLLCGVVRDVTERMRAGQAQRQSEERFRMVVDASKDAMVAIDRQGLITIFNPAAEETFGRQKEEMIGRPLDDLMPEEYRAAHRQYVQDYFTTGTPHGAIGTTLELPAERSGGSRFPVELSLSVGRRADEPFALAVIRDITERKRMEDTLRRQALVFDNMYDAVVVTDPTPRIADWNPGAQRLFGYTRDEVLGKSVEILHRPEEAAVLVPRIRDTVKRDGQWSGELNLIHKDGSERICETIVVPLLDDKNRFVGTIGVARDITERKRAEAEARRRQDELTHVSRLATMGQMASELAHEINQPLAAIRYYARGCARRLRAGTPDSDEILAVMDQVAGQAERAGAFVERLRTFVRKGEPRLAGVDLNPLVREAAEFVEHEARASGVLIEFRLAAALPAVLADPIQIEQVILNLLRNGIEAVQEIAPGKRRLTLRTFNAGGGAVAFAASDTGRGFSPEAADRLFEPFFSTKPEGLGMGLSISRSIIEAHRGRLWATPNPVGGATFMFTLPVSERG